MIVSGIPMKTSTILDFVSRGGEITFDFSQCAIGAKHALQYLSYLKVTHTAINYDANLLAEFIRCPWLLGKTSLVEDLKNLLCIYKHNHMWSQGAGLDEDSLRIAATEHGALLEELMGVLQSIPHFLAVKSSSGKIKPNATAEAPNVGVNFARLFEDPAFLTYLLSEWLCDPECGNAPYYTEHFEPYRYGGDALVWFVVNNPECDLVNRSFQ
jgi:hypothetical protein